MNDLHRAVGRLIVPRLDMDDPVLAFDIAAEWLQTYGVRSMIVFGGRPQDVATTLNRLQKLCDSPFLVGADLERGAGQQFEGATVLPYLKGLGEHFRRTGSTALVRKAAEITAIEASACGIAVNFSPVVDVDVNPMNPIVAIRSFGEDPKTVIECAHAYVEEHARHSVLPVLKHFPGHGDTTVDSHERLPELNFDRDRLEAVELRPFKELLASHPTVGIMTGHLSARALDPSGNPASLSEAMTTGLLRGTWKYGGVVFTDALMMGAVASSDAPLKAFEAGADQLLMPVDLDHTIRSIANAVEKDAACERRLTESIGRLDRLLVTLKRPNPPDVKEAERLVGCREHRQAADHIFSEVACFRLGDSRDTFGRTTVLRLEAQRGSLNSLEKSGIPSIGAWFGESPPPLPDHDRLIVVTDLKPAAWKNTATLSSEWVGYLNEALKKNHLVVSTGTDRLGDQIPALRNYFCTYGSLPEAVKLIRRIVGD